MLALQYAPLTWSIHEAGRGLPNVLLHVIAKFFPEFPALVYLFRGFQEILQPQKATATFIHFWKWMNWNEWVDMNDLKWMSWNEWVEMNEMTWRNWNEGIEMNELTCQKWSETCFFLRVLCDQLLGDDVVDICAFCRPHLPKGLSDPQFLNMFKWKSSSRYSIVHILSTSSSKSAPSPSVFLTFSVFKWKSSSRYSFVHFCRPHLPKVLQTRQLLRFFMWNRALATVSCTFCRPHLPKLLRTPQFFYGFYMKPSLSLQSCELFVDHFPRSSRAPAETETLLRRPRQPRYPKKNGGSRPRVFSSLNSHVPNSHSSKLLAWWCGCHDDWGDRHGEKASHDNRS